LKVQDQAYFESLFFFLMIKAFFMRNSYGIFFKGKTLLKILLIFLIDIINLIENLHNLFVCFSFLIIIDYARF